MVVLLLAAAVVSLALGDRLEAAAIGIVLVINTVIGFTTEWRARRAMEALLELDVPRAPVIRDGQLRSGRCAHARAGRCDRDERGPSGAGRRAPRVDNRPAPHGGRAHG